VLRAGDAVVFNDSRDAPAHDAVRDEHGGLVEGGAKRGLLLKCSKYTRGSASSFNSRSCICSP
jgi:hypothetical protein